MTSRNTLESHMPDLSALAQPETGVTSYSLEIGLGQVWSDAKGVRDDIRVYATERPDELDIIFKQILPTTLAWVDFYARARLEITHSDAFIAAGYPDIPGAIPRAKSEVIRGNPMVISPRKYLADRNSENPIFLTTDQIIAEGFLRPDMETWYRSFLRYGKFHDSRFNVFNALLHRE